MCPDRSILSAYFDEEVPTPFKEKIQEHIEECPGCQKEISKFDKISGLLNSCQEVAIDEDRTLENLLNKAKNRKTLTLWKKRIQIPLPIAAAAAAVFFVLMGHSIFVNHSLGTYVAREQLKTEVPMEVSYQDLDLLIEIIESKEGLQSGNTMILPASESLKPMGDPTFLRSTSYGRE